MLHFCSFSGKGQRVDHRLHKEHTQMMDELQEQLNEQSSEMEAQAESYEEKLNVSLGKSILRSQILECVCQAILKNICVLEVMDSTAI